MVKPYESIDFKGLNGGSGWTRTTDLTLIRSDPHTLRGKVVIQPYNLLENEKVYQLHKGNFQTLVI